jgi:molybdopterin-guanine dinucleotide biosynthesis protein A
VDSTDYPYTDKDAINVLHAKAEQTNISVVLKVEPERWLRVFF